MNNWRQILSWETIPEKRLSPQEQLYEFSRVFKRWLPMLDTLGFPYKVRNLNIETSDNEPRANFDVLTKRNRYSISAYLPSQEDREAQVRKMGYVGCTVTNRRNGKGNDLADGPFTLATWREIVLDIHNYEFGIGWEPL